MTVSDELTAVLTLEPVEVNLFRGLSPAYAHNRIYGGQVVAQALTAAYKTIEARICHSLQCYFIRPGDPRHPVLYQVERSRDGKSFATRRVIAIQNGEQIFNMACSFQVPEEGFEHASAMPPAPAPDTLADDLMRMRELYKAAPKVLPMMENRPVELRAIEPEGKNPEQMIWVRMRADMGDDVALNQVLLAYASDYSLLATALRPHTQRPFATVQMASLDHVIWFHRPTNFSRWHLYVQDSPSANGARGLSRGAIYNEDGVLIASAAQEGLIRPIAG